MSGPTPGTVPAVRPVPDRGYPDFAAFWRGTAVGELRVPACEECGRNVWPPRMACPGCAGITFGWHAIGNRGVLYSWTRIGRAMLAGFEAEVPYAVVIVEAEADPRVRFVGRLALECDRADIEPEIGAALEAVFVPSGDVTLVYWRPAASGRPSGPGTVGAEVGGV